MAIEIGTAYTKEVSDNLGNARMVYDKSHVIQKYACGEPHSSHEGVRV